jgi:hypothetical protein
MPVVTASPAPATPGVTPVATAAPVATLTPVATPAATAAPTAFPTATPEPAPIAITDVECLTGLTVRFHVHIATEQAITMYQLWSTWGGGGNSDVTLSPPLPHAIDEDVEFTHTQIDPVENRIHEFGLAVTVEGATDPIIVYAFEPDFRCPGH